MTPAVEKSPEWFGKSFLQTAIRSYKRDDTIEVLGFEVKSGFSEHYCSSMFQSKVEFKSHKFRKAEPEALNVVIKAMPLSEEGKMRIVSGSPLFETETRMYSKTLPAFRELFERSGLKIELGPE